VEESITRSAGAGGGSAMSVERLVELITESGKTPVERDTFYNILRVYDESTVTADL
jgi:aminodeoxyfutalosine synthase